ncbi:hypothetical protein JZ751_001411 [Albula glossodonta]|uniref:MORN repeat-containing protein 3 n=1 Tax=Albula glossodonta TaxID=121402 RepID=A0A8T2PTW4_9TELE|nr:hypothetical protein JZ751_001411 [Albula glossodonta]
MPFLKASGKTTINTLLDRMSQKNGLRHTIYLSNGNKYTGEWLSDMKHGKGTEVYKKTGAIYDGDWKHGKRNGFGTFSVQQLASKDLKKIYTGEWKDNKKDGYGTYFYSDSVHYEGEWSKDKRSGWGRMYYENGDIYEGEWKQDNHDGQGILWLANGNRYEGSWKDGKKHGPGKFFFPNKGQLHDGVWVEDVAKYGTLTDSGRSEASDPTTYPIPKVYLEDVHSVLMEAQSCLKARE